MYINSNLTSREALNLFGTLPADHIERLIDIEEAQESARGVAPYIEEAITCFPGEDFIESEGVLDDLRKIAKTVRGDNRVAILAVIEKLEGVQLGTARQAEYGVSELRNALREIE